jgi:hypothetical protein
MKRRLADPLVPVARVTAVGLVAAAATLAATQGLTTHVSPQPATGLTPSSASTAIAKLVAIPDYPDQAARSSRSISATITEQTEINRVATLINNLPPAPTGVFNCLLDTGGGLTLKFESNSGTVVEQAVMDATGCGGTRITIAGKQSARASGEDTIQQVQHILGTNWQVGLLLPH